MRVHFTIYYVLHHQQWTQMDGPIAKSKNMYCRQRYLQQWTFHFQYYCGSSFLIEMLRQHGMSCMTNIFARSRTWTQIHIMPQHLHALFSHPKNYHTLDVDNIKCSQTLRCHSIFVVDVLHYKHMNKYFLNLNFQTNFQTIKAHLHIWHWKCYCGTSICAECTVNNWTLVCC